MSLNEFVSVNTHYTRSINLERDSNSVDVVGAYIPTSRALRTLSRVVDGFSDDLSPRAWSLIGPYGSGKSSFSVFLSHLMSNPSESGTRIAFNVLGKHQKRLAQQFEREVSDRDGYLKVLITGAPEPLSNRLVKGLANAVEDYWPGKGRKPKVIADLHKAAQSECSSSEIIALVSELQRVLLNRKCKGILLVIDELGKFLEYEARHYGANDIYLLQALAEHACKGDEINLFLFVLLHQSFEQYAKGLGENLKNEWSKVQGRFEEVPFLESSEQVLRVVSAAFSHRFNPDDQSLLLDNTDKAIGVLIEQEAIPSALTHQEAVNLYVSCYPLHPVSAVMLPLLCQKVAQNERTLFSYLGSHEEFGLQHMLQTISDVGAYVYPHHIYDYFITNQPAVLGDYLTHRRWAEVVTAIERLGDATEDEVNMLKTIGLLNIIGSKGGFKASKEILSTCAVNKSRAIKALKSLSDKSIITYRRFNSEYRVWQGSDFDLEVALQDEINNIGQFALAEELTKMQTMQPIVARKYTIKSGSLRYFQPVFVDARSYKSEAQQNSDARLIFFLASDQDDEKIFHQEVTGYFSDLDIVALNLNGAQLYEAVAENLALHRVRATRQELNSDPVAKREFEDRLAAAESSLDHLLTDLINRPEQADWYHKKTHLSVSNKRQMQTVLSQVLDKVYHQSPVIFNELINRDRPSTQANAARNKLLAAMQNKADKKDLGIEKFPAEKGLYRAVLKATGLHRYNERDDVWYLSAPEMDGGKDRCKLRHVWQRIEDFLDSTESEAKSFADLNADLMAPPYGVKAGLLPILYFAAYLVNQHEVAVYEQRRYRPYFTDEMLDRFIRRPDEFQVQRFKITGLRASIFAQYSKVIHGDDSKKRTLLELAKPLATFMGGLPEYTQITRRGLSEKTQKVRAAFNMAKSPEKLLFEALPRALGFDVMAADSSQESLEAFSQSLVAALRELKSAYDVLLDKQKTLMAQAFNVDPALPLAEVRKILAGNFHGLENFTVDVKGLRAFIMRVTKSQGTDEEWFENILMYLANKPSTKWKDSDQDAAEYRLADLSRRVIDLEKLRMHEKDLNSKGQGDFDVYLIRSIKKGGGMYDEVVAVNHDRQNPIIEAKQAIVDILRQLPDKELRLGALAEVTNEFLDGYKQEHPGKALSQFNGNVKLATGGKL